MAVTPTAVCREDGTTDAPRIGVLYLVATPIGNLGDITYRAVEVLRSVKAVVAEDTRRARILCDRFGIGTSLVSMPAFREQDQAESLVLRLLGGDDLALVTDAGSPGISDPGTVLVQQAILSGIAVVPVPGPSAVIAALSASGLRTDRFYFAGFLPRKGPSRERSLNSLKRLDATLVCLESPERIGETLAELAAVFGERRAVLAREITKAHEEFARGTLSELAAKFADGARGEITLVIEGATEESAHNASDEAISEEIRQRLSAGESSIKEIAKDLAQATGRSRSEVYALALKVRESR